jgi:hypothetical protein
MSDDKRFTLARSEGGDKWWVVGWRGERLFWACEDDAIAVCSLLNSAYATGAEDGAVACRNANETAETAL